MTASDDPLRTRLRAETAGAHRRLEEALDLPARLTDREAAARILSRFRGFFAELEPALDRALGTTVMTGRHRLPDLDADLAALGLSGEAIRRLPASPDAGSAMTREAALGALYVVEGARLGGRVIGRAVRAAPWRPPGFSRFWVDQPDLAGHWAGVLGLLAREPEGDALIDGANLAFRRLTDWLESGGTLRSDDRRCLISPSSKTRSPGG